MREFLRDRRLYFSITLVILLSDRLTKMLVESHLDPLRPVTIIPGCFQLTYVENPGGVFGLFRDLAPGLRAGLFTVIPIIAVLLILLYAHKTAASDRLTQSSLALILGGALGNLVDRLRIGYVVDFLDVYWGDLHWPAFNIADSAICVGVGLLVLEGLLSREPAHDPDAERRAT